MKLRWPHVRAYLQAHRRRGIVALLFFIASINNLDRQTLSVLAPTLEAGRLIDTAGWVAVFTGIGFLHLTACGVFAPGLRGKRSA